MVQGLSVRWGDFQLMQGFPENAEVHNSAERHLYYSNVSRGKRKKEMAAENGDVSLKPEVIGVAAPPVSKELKKRWSYFKCLPVLEPALELT